MKNFIVLSVVTFCFVAGAAPKVIETKNEDFRCAKLLSTPLADFKATLVENCDLNKPFSTSLSRLLNEDTFFYCCHKK